MTLSEELREDFGGNAVPDRFYELSGNEPAEVIEAVEAFTVPCRLCVPGARELGQLVPFDFIEWGDEEEPDEEEE